jgi:GNAT superfamily N-acetyltransferase
MALSTSTNKRGSTTTAKRGGIVVKPVTRARWADMEELFERPGPRGGKTYSSGCWCVLWRVPAKEHQMGWGRDKGPDRGAGNKALMERIVQRGDRPGLLAYDDGVAVGWCAVGPRADLPRIRTSASVADLPEPDDEGIWSVSCFYVHGSAKRQGVAGALLDAAIETATKAGARVLEGYPVAPGHGDPFTGHAALYEAAGFTVQLGATSRGLARLRL